MNRVGAMDALDPEKQSQTHTHTLLHLDKCANPLHRVEMLINGSCRLFFFFKGK